MKKTQKQRVIDRITDVGYVDNFWSIETRTSIRLGAIIFDLKQEGWDFKTVMKEKNCHYIPIKNPVAERNTRREAFVARMESLIQ